MNNRNLLQNYVNNFRRHLSIYFKPNVGMSAKIFPTNSNGAIVEFQMGEGIENDDEFQQIEQTINDALKEIPQNAFGGNLDAYNFSGTNVVAEGNRIIIIKGDEDASEWDDVSAKKDVEKVLPKK